VRNDLEPGTLEHRQRPAVDVARRHPLALRHLDGVGLQEPRAVLAGVVDTGLEELPGDAAAASLTPDDETDDRPDRLVVERLQDGRMGEPLVILTRADADPADRLVAVVPDEARGTVFLSGRVCRGLHRRAMALLTALREVKAADPEVRAPAPLRVTALLEEGGQVRKAFGRQGPNVEGGCSHRARS